MNACIFEVQLHPVLHRRTPNLDMPMLVQT